jgi:limonene-1,2-epoxide hydrolase
MTQSNEAIMRRFLALWSVRDAAGMEAMFAEGGTYDNVPNKAPLVGRAAIRAWLDACFNHLTRIDVEVLNIASNGEWVLSERLDDHVVGEKHMKLPVMNACRIAGGQIVMFRDYYCRQTVKDLGMG